MLVSGTNFTTGARVTLYGGTGGTTTIEAVNETFVSPAQIRCNLAIPADAYPGSYTVNVRNPPAYIMDSAHTGSRADAFTVTAPIPRVTGISPNSALVGTTLGTVTVTGTGFANGAEVAINGGNSSTWIYATGETWVSPTQIRCSLAIPADAYPGSYGVYVRNPGIAEWYGRLSGFTVLAPTPTVTGISPNSALRGTTLYTVNVYGTGFTRGAVVALIGGYDWIYATDEFWISPTQIQCTLAIPENAAHSFYNVGVINPGGPYPNSTIVFYVTAPTPTVTGISPNTAAPDTMGSFYVSGTGFAFGAEVEIRGGTGSATTIGVLGTSRVNSTTLLCTLIIEPGTPRVPTTSSSGTPGASGSPGSAPSPSSRRPSLQSRRRRCCRRTRTATASTTT